MAFSFVMRKRNDELYISIMIFIQFLREIFKSKLKYLIMVVMKMKTVTVSIEFNPGIVVSVYERGNRHIDPRPCKDTDNVSLTIVKSGESYRACYDLETGKYYYVVTQYLPLNQADIEMILVTANGSLKTTEVTYTTISNARRLLTNGVTTPVLTVER